jgi:cytoplasmic iron level regulating protein YaaA (DUF328/UPF0246 family)
LSKSKGNSDIQSCVKCLEWEKRLKEIIIDELSSAQVIIDLLSSEMCVETEKKTWRQYTNGVEYVGKNSG